MKLKGLLKISIAFFLVMLMTACGGGQDLEDDYLDEPANIDVPAETDTDSDTGEDLGNDESTE